MAFASAFGVAYYLSARVAALVIVRPTHFVAFWLPSGVYVAALLLAATREWPLLAVAALCAGLAHGLGSGQPPALALLLASCASAEALLGAGLMRRFVARRPTLETQREVIGLVTFCATLGPALAAMVASAALTGRNGSLTYWSTWRAWWGGGFVGIMAAAPLVLTWAAHDPHRITLRRTLEALALAACLVLTGILILGETPVAIPAYGYLAPGLLIWAAFRLGPRGASATLAALIALVGYRVAENIGDAAVTLTQASLSWNIFTLHLFLGAMASVALVLTAVTTDRQKTAAALRTSEEKFSRAFRMSPDAVIISRLADGLYRDVNRGFSEITGYSQEETVGKTALASGSAIWANPEDRAQLLAKLNASGEVAGVEAQFRRKNGTLLTGLMTARVIEVAGERCILSITRDVTQEREAQRALLESERRYRLISENMGDVVWTLDLASRRFTYVSPSVARLRGYTPEEVMAQPLEHALTSESLRTVVLNLPLRIAAVGAGREDLRIMTSELDQPCKDGSVVPTEVVTTLIRDAAGKVTEILGVTRDIRERRRSERERQELESHLRQAQKMESVGRLAGGIAHDFNNLLSPILGYSELLLESTPAGTRAHGEIEGILRAAERARDLTRQLLAFGRKQVLALKPLDMRAVVTNFEHLLRRTLHEDIRIETRLSESLGTVRGDAGQIEQVLMNLAINAQDAMPQGGHLRLELADAQVDDSPGGGALPGAYVRLTVSDTGSGMTPDVLEHLYEPFYTTKEQGKGTGLGLSTVFGIVRQHNGFITVRSESGQGTAFAIYLPHAAGTVRSEASAAAAAEPPPGTPAPATAASVAPSRAGEVVALAEDNEPLRDLAARALERQGYQVLQAESGERCLEILRAFGGPVHLLLTDVIMPGMNGRELYDRLSAERPGLRVLYMSGYSDEVIAHRGALNQGIAFIPKPFTVNALAAKVREVLDR